jgi:tetratricopeptide (TPR) repeat protein
VIVLPSSLLPATPNYVAGATANVYTAQFPSGACVRATAERARAYPGLIGPAPATGSLYRAFASQLRPGCEVWDIGSGSGHGCRWLMERGSVVGIECDPDARAFATAHNEGVPFSALDAWLKRAPTTPTALTFVDVLAHTADPEALLWQLRAASDPEVVFVAEAKAFAGQSLLAPAAVAFSRRTLRSLLIRGGFQIESWLPDTAFVCAVVRPCNRELGHAFAQARHHARDGGLEAAIQCLAAARDCTDAAIRAEALTVQAELHFAQNDGDGASRCLLEALRHDPEQVNALAGLAQLVLGCGDLAQAAELANRAFALDPVNPDAACAQALVLSHVSLETAVTAWRHAVDLAPARQDVVFAFAQAVANAGDAPAAIRAMERLMSYGAKLSADYHLTVAWLLLQAERANDARLELRQATLLAPDHPALGELSEALKQAPGNAA